MGGTRGYGDHEPQCLQFESVRGPFIARQSSSHCLISCYLSTCQSNEGINGPQQYQKKEREL